MVIEEACYYDPHERGVVCRLCPRGCIIGEGRSGFCRVRKNIGGVLFAENYGACSSYALDPIEKKPLYHFYPGSYIFSIGTWGCNFTCRFCQNWQIAQENPETVYLEPEKTVDMAVKVDKRNIGLAFTYSEPSVWYEYVLATAKQLKARGLKSVLVTNGFINLEPLSELLPFVDALNIDVKAFNEDYYRNVCAGRLEDVKRTVEMAVRMAHVEITCLLVGGLNDAPEDLEGLASWLADLDKDIPLHFSRYFPNYKLKVPPTPPEKMELAYLIARRYLNYVYLGNIGGIGVNTYCPECKFLVIDRLKLVSNLAEDNKCPCCGKRIKIIGKVVF
ncbi:MAG: pflA 2 [Firmicutes bacterium]|nr:pflA 2 [Bacillota bacterium]